MTNQAVGASARREITVEAPIERAFHTFTEGMPNWWPHETHHVGPTPADAVMEPFEGGRCYNRAHGDGTETEWGRVMAWEPPARVVFAWMLTPQWQFEPDPSKASEVEVRFTALEDGRTRVDLEHSGFERYAKGGDEMRDTVDSAGGWGLLLDLYVAELS
jgi:uncharacterized protein YndB with AHSA1/START domain